MTKQEKEWRKFNQAVQENKPKAVLLSISAKMKDLGNKAAATRWLNQVPSSTTGARKKALRSRTFTKSVAFHIEQMGNSAGFLSNKV